MKCLLVVLACVATLIAAANSSPLVSREQAIETAVERALKQVLGRETSILQSDEESTPNEESSSDEDSSKPDNMIQNIYAEEQLNKDNVEAQFFKKLWKKIKKIGKKVMNNVKKAYNFYNKVKNCPESPEMPQPMEDAIIETFFAQEMRARAQNEEDDGLSVQIQALLADKQTPAAVQFWKKLFNFGRRAYNVYNKIKNGQCVQVQEWPEGLEDAAMESFMTTDADAVKVAALFELMLE